MLKCALGALAQDEAWGDRIQALEGAYVFLFAGGGPASVDTRSLPSSRWPEAAPSDRARSSFVMCPSVCLSFYSSLLWGYVMAGTGQRIGGRSVDWVLCSLSRCAVGSHLEPFGHAFTNFHTKWPNGCRWPLVAHHDRENKGQRTQSREATNPSASAWRRAPPQHRKLER